MFCLIKRPLTYGMLYVSPAFLHKQQKGEKSKTNKNEVDTQTVKAAKQCVVPFNMSCFLATTTLLVKYFKGHYFSQRAWIEFWIPFMSGWFRQPTLCCSIANKMSGGPWVQFVKAAFRHTCLSGRVNDPLQRGVLQKESPSHPFW